MPLAFQNNDVEQAYFSFSQVFEALRNAEVDYAQFTAERREDPKSDCRRLLLLDFNVLYPFIAPRIGGRSTKDSDKHDYICERFFSEIEGYQSLLGYIPVYTPFLLIELYDRLDHLGDQLTKIAKSETDAQLRSALVSIIPKLGTSPAEVEQNLEIARQKVESIKVRDRIQSFIHLVKNGIVRDIFSLIGREQFFRCLQSEDDEYKEISTQIDAFRKVNEGDDPDDRRMHRAIDILTVLLTTKLRRHVNEYTVYYVGQDKLRRIFGSRVNDLSRDITTAYSIIRGLSRIPSDLSLQSEVVSGIRIHKRLAATLMNTLSEHREFPKLPYEVLRTIHSGEGVLADYLFGERKMGTKEQYDRLATEALDTRLQLRSAASKAAAETKEAAAMLKEIVDFGITADMNEIAKLVPNTRLEAIYSKYLDLKP